VLLLACANLANLTLARLLSRQREIVVRAALGASRGRIIRQLLTESTLVAVAGAIVGLLLARGCMSLLVSFARRFTPRASEVHIDGWVLLFALAVAVLTGLAFGSLPALQATRQRLSDGLREGGTRTTVGAAGNRARALLVVVQVAISFVLLIGAGLTLRSLLKLQRVQPGINRANVLTASIELPFSKYHELDDARAFFTRLLDRLEARPGVIAAALANDNPLEGNLFNPAFKIESQPIAPGEPEPRTSFHSVSTGYFRALAIPLLEGRLFKAGDTAEAPLVAVVNSSLARRSFPSRSALGQKITITSFGSGKYRTIVGVVADVKQHGLQAEAGPGLYYPLGQAARGEGTLLIRTAGDPTRMIGDLRATVRALDPEQPLAQVQTLEQVHGELLAPSRLTTTLLLLFAVLAFVITITGVSGVTAFFVSERRQEIGVRLALGARQGDVLWLVLRQGVELVAAGLVVGGAAALGLGRLFSSLLFGIEPTDPPTFILVPLALLAVVSLACLLPARRAMRVDPVIALRG
jgi:putative ABC transport system permease protein